MSTSNDLERCDYCGQDVPLQEAYDAYNDENALLCSAVCANEYEAMTEADALDRAYETIKYKDIP